ncbi:MAG: S8 family serine peptidase [Microcoleaceae cyanobacterium]
MNDYYQFTLENGSDLEITLDDLTGDADIQMIQDVNNNGVIDFGEQLEYPFEFGTTPESLETSLAAGTYIVRVLGFFEEANYTLTLSSTEITQPTDGAGNSLDTAFEIGLLEGTTSFTDFVDLASDPDDYYQFTLDNDSELEVTLDGLSGDADLQLIQDFDGNGIVDFGEILEYPFEIGTTPETLETSLSSGTYFVRVFPVSNQVDYTLTLTGTEIELPEDGAGNTLDTARDIGLLEGTVSFSDAVDLFDQDDFYQFTLDSDSELDVTLDGLSADADIQLIQDVNSDGFVDFDEILEYPFEIGTAPENLQTFLESGVYFIRVLRFEGETDYELTLSGTPVNLREDFAGNTLATARNLDLVEGSQTFSDFVGSSDPIDLYEFETDQTSNFSVSLTGLTADADLQLIQDRNQNGTVDFDDVVAGSYAAGDAAESLEIEGLEPGTYFLDILQYLGDTDYDLTVTLETLFVPEDNAGNTLDQALDIGSLVNTQTFNDFVGATDSDDFYLFTLDQTSDFSLSLTGLSSDADVRVIQDGNENGLVDFGEILNSSINAGSADESITLRELEAGSYFVEVYPYIGDTNYELELVAEPLETEEEPGVLDTAIDLGLLNADQSVSDFVGDSDPVDIYSFTLNRSEDVSITLEDLGTDADLQLIEDLNGNGVIDFGEVIESSTRSGSTSEEIFQNDLSAGTYFVRVFQFSGDTDYTLNLSPAQSGTNSFNRFWGFGNVDAAAAVASATGSDVPFADVPDIVDDSDLVGGFLGDLVDYGVNQINAPEVWAQGFTGDGVVVAVLDTGVDYRHFDLNSNIWINEDEIPNNGIDEDGNGFIDDRNGYDFSDNDFNPVDRGEDRGEEGNQGVSRGGHGTHVAGTIAGEQNGAGTVGVAPDATIMPVRVLGGLNRGSQDTIADGIFYAVNNGADVINMSLGISGPDLLQSPQLAIESALEFARSQGVTVVIAAGNERDNWILPVTQPVYPGRYAQDGLAIAVGAVDDDLKFAEFSNPAGDAVGPYAFLSAPGVEIISTVPDDYTNGAPISATDPFLSDRTDLFINLDGTSMATPHVAGVVALMLEANPDLTPEEVEDILTQTANPEDLALA